MSDVIFLSFKSIIANQELLFKQLLKIQPGQLRTACDSRMFYQACEINPIHFNYDYILQVMDMFQESLVNEGFQLIAAETFRDDPKSRIETLKVSLSLNLQNQSFTTFIWLTNPKMHFY